MEIGSWVLQNWFDLLSASGVVAGLVFTAVSLRSEAKTRRVANLLTITANHREIWKEYINDEEITRVLDSTADLLQQPVTRGEEMFVNLVILHTSSVFYAMKDEIVIKLEGLRRDVAQFFSLPIPKAIWERAKLVQNDDFVSFVESCINWK